MSIKKRAYFLFAVTAILFAVSAVSLFFAPETHAEQAPSAVYRLLFDDSEDLGKNSAVGDIPSATVVQNGGVSVTPDAWKGQPALTLRSTGHLTNYIQVPISVMNNASVTIAGWFKFPSSLYGWPRVFEIHDGKGDEGSWVSVMPYGDNSYKGLNINMRVDGVQKTGAGSDINFIHDGADPEMGNTPAADYILPVYDAWTHYAYEFTPTGFSMYQNGRLLVTKSGDFTGSKFYGENGKFIIGATDKWGDADISCAISDFRVYSSALGGEQIASEYDFRYSDFLTGSFDFENAVKDGSPRGYDGWLDGNAKTEFIEDRNSRALVIDGSAGSEVLRERSSAKLPVKSVHGHNALTFMGDFYIDGTTGDYSRLLEFASYAPQYLTLGAKYDGGKAALWFSKNDRESYSAIMFDMPFDRWFSLCFTIDGYTATVYIDGIPIASSDEFKYKNSIYWDAGNDMCLSLGCTAYYNDAPAKCKMDNIKLYQIALSPKNILQEMGIITIDDDESAVRGEYDKFAVEYDGISPKIVIPEYAGEGVKLSWTSDNDEIIAADGTVLPGYVDTEVNITVTFSRGDISMNKVYKVTVNAKDKTNVSVYAVSEMSDVKFDGKSFYAELMKVNLDYMMRLDKDRLLYEYRKQAGLDTRGKQSYGGWINPAGGGAGQFGAHYVIALAKASQTMPDYRYKGESVLDRLAYMVTELKKCQDKFAENFPEEAGYIGAISTKAYDALLTGESTITDPYGDEHTVWVPWCFFHKKLEMLLDVYWYAADDTLKATALSMLDKAADWTYNKMSPLTQMQRDKVLLTEYGGMAETLYQTYAITGKTKHFNAAKYFEEKALLDSLYNNTDVFARRHANTTIPKILGAAAAYEITGEEYYKTICVNAYEMVMTRTYAFGGTSIAEHWESENGVTSLGWYSAELCCSYNMLKLADYLFRWTGDKKYMDYYENVYTNHILASMDPDSGGKMYFTNTEFGNHKIYHSFDNSFWCCGCTGLETFAQLPRGIYYKGDGAVRVNMFYPTEYKVSDTLTLVQSGDFYTEQKTTLTVRGSGKFTLALRVPDWAENGFTVKVNGTAIDVTPADGYVNITREWADGDTAEYEVPFSFRLDKRKGGERSYALMYGPIMLVADLGTDNVDDIRDNNIEHGSVYTGTTVDKIVLDGTLGERASVDTDGGKLTVTVKTVNQGDLIFRPYNDIFHSRYGMFFDYYGADEDYDADYTADGNERGCEFDRPSDLNAFTEYGSAGGLFALEDGMLISPASGEYKLMAGLSLSAPYVLEITVAPYTLDGRLNGGVYLMSSDPGRAQDMITAYNIQIERSARSSVYKLSAYKFGGFYIGQVASVELDFPQDGTIRLHILVRDGNIYVYVNGNRNKALAFSVDRSFISPDEPSDVGIRAQACKMKFDGLRIISAELPVGTSVLESAIAVAERVDTGMYVSSCVSEFKSALASAETVIGNAASTQRQINEANAALRAAISALERRGDSTALDNAFIAVAGLDGRNYTESSFASVKTALVKIAETDLSDVTQSVIDGLLGELTSAVMQLEKTSPDTAALTAAIEKAKAAVPSDYTAESYAALVSAIENASALGSDATAVQTDEALIRLLDAELRLVRVPDAPDSNVDAGTSGGADNGLAIAAIAVSSVMLAAMIVLTVTYTVKRKKHGRKE